MFSLNEWVVKGKVMEVVKKQRGLRITVKGIADNPTLFNSDCFRIRCWISKRVLGDKTLKNNVSMRGRFQFKNKDCYFIADTIN